MAAVSIPLVLQKEARTMRTPFWDWWPQWWYYIPFPGMVTKAVVAASGAQNQGAAGLGAVCPADTVVASYRFSSMA